MSTRPAAAHSQNGSHPAAAETERRVPRARPPKVPPPPPHGGPSQARGGRPIRQSHGRRPIRPAHGRRRGTLAQQRRSRALGSETPVQSSLSLPPLSFIPVCINNAGHSYLVPTPLSSAIPPSLSFGFLSVCINNVDHGFLVSNPHSSSIPPSPSLLFDDHSNDCVCSDSTRAVRVGVCPTAHSEPLGRFSAALRLCPKLARESAPADPATPWRAASRWPS